MFYVEFNYIVKKKKKETEDISNNINFQNF